MPDARSCPSTRAYIGVPAHATWFFAARSSAAVAAIYLDGKDAGAVRAGLGGLALTSTRWSSPTVRPCLGRAPARRDSVAITLRGLGASSERAIRRAGQKTSWPPLRALA